MLLFFCAGLIGSRPPCRSSIDEGVLAPREEVLGSCDGYNATGGYYRCGGIGNQLEWKVMLQENFTITATLLLESTGATAAAFSFFSLNGEDYFGLDGEGSKFFYEGAHWGHAHLTAVDTPEPDTWFNISLVKSGGNLVVGIDGKPVVTVPTTWSADVGFGFRPWRSTVQIKALQLCQTTFPAPLTLPPSPAPPALTTVFLNGEGVPGYANNTYGFQIPAITKTPKGALS